MAKTTPGIKQKEYAQCQQCGAKVEASTMVKAIFSKTRHMMLCSACNSALGRNGNGKCASCGIEAYTTLMHIFQANRQRIKRFGPASEKFLCDDYRASLSICNICGKLMPNTRSGGRRSCADCTPSAQCREHDWKIKPVMHAQADDETDCSDVSNTDPVYLTTRGVEQLKKTVMMGVEIETDGGKKCEALIEEIEEGNRFLRTKHDGSLSVFGFEVVSQPANLRFHHKSAEWKQLFRLLKEYEYDNSTRLAGMHVHIDLHSFIGTSGMTVWEVLGRWVFMMIMHRSLFEYVGGRSGSNETVRRYSCYPNDKYRISPKLLADKLAKISQWYYWTDHEHRYQAINMHGLAMNQTPTAEMRFMLAPVEWSSFFVRLEFIDAMTRYCRRCSSGPETMTDYAKKNSTLACFVEYANEHKARYINLTPFLSNIVASNDLAKEYVPATEEQEASGSE